MNATGRVAGAIGAILAGGLLLVSAAAAQMPRGEWESCLERVYVFDAMMQQDARGAARYSEAHPLATGLLDAYRRAGVEAGYLDAGRFSSVDAIRGRPSGMSADESRLMGGLAGAGVAAAVFLTPTDVARRQGEAEQCGSRLAAFVGGGAAVGLIDATRPEALRALVDTAHPGAELEFNDRGVPRIFAAAEGFNYGIFFYGCDGGENCRSLLFSASFTMNEAPRLETMNTWNSDRIIGQASVDGNRAIVSHFVGLRGGVSPETFRAVLNDWRIALRDFAQHIDF
ncbi:MAG: YbjN domain-containing protein [Rhodobacteraceae bacterium]|nr:YbjN domain-containing protein [Paracoccaceae bacterium]